jgi:hypothetical protein
MCTVCGKVGFVGKNSAIIALHGMHNIKPLVMFVVATEYAIPHPRRRFLLLGTLAGVVHKQSMPL